MKFKRAFKTLYIVQAALIAAVYAILTTVLISVSSGIVQIRVSEALTILPAFTPAAIPGLFIGCLVANMLNASFGIWDIVLGSLATLTAAFLSYRLRARKWLVPLPPVLVNALVIGPMLYFVYGLKFLPSIGAWNVLLNILSVGTGQVIACYGLGMPLYFAVEKLWKKI